jgi:hypothetical protein
MDDDNGGVCLPSNRSGFAPALEVQERRRLILASPPPPYSRGQRRQRRVWIGLDLTFGIHAR